MTPAPELQPPQETWIMSRSYTCLAALSCALMLALGACKKSDSGRGTTTGTGGTYAGTGGTTSATGGTTGGSAATTGGAGTAAVTANMPDPTCKAMPSMTTPACQNCSCSPDTAGGCLTEL